MPSQVSAACSIFPSTADNFWPERKSPGGPQVCPHSSRKAQWRTFLMDITELFAVGKTSLGPHLSCLSQITFSFDLEVRIFSFFATSQLTHLHFSSGPSSFSGLFRRGKATLMTT